MFGQQVDAQDREVGDGDVVEAEQPRQPPTRESGA
jgi:hypothetical protein